MSTFEDYTAVSNNYSSQRIAVGADIFLNSLTEHYKDKDLSQINVLDAGCGTGNYTASFCEAGVGKISMFDGNPGMLRMARSKLEPYIASGIVEDIRENLLPQIPYSSDTFDAVMINQVLHHLDKDGHSSGYPNVIATLRESHRVLKPNGLLLLSYSSPEQVAHGFWYIQLIPAASEKHAQKCRCTNSLNAALPSIGFSAETLKTQIISQPSPSLTFDDPEGPLRKEWRDQDSFFSGATAKEVDNMVALLMESAEQGTLQQLYDRCNMERDKYGHTTFLTATKTK